MAKKMLIDATHPEETRVVVVEGNRVEEFDYESINKQQLAGNIYLAKVTRVEPSLQAAFVEYGGNRHGFLAFSEIHPDYYQIPLADREALLAAEAEAAAAEEAAEEEQERARNARKRGRTASKNTKNGQTRGKGRGGRSKRRGFELTGLDETDAAALPEALQSLGAEGQEASWHMPPLPAVEEDELARILAELTQTRASQSAPIAAQAEAAHLSESISEELEDDEDDAETADADNADTTSSDKDEDGADADVEEVGAEDSREEVQPRRLRVKKYNIQEVIKKRQILLVQVVKEERGTKGAALTTYLSLAGRYCVLMPNTARGGGISRKITNAADRKRLKALANDLEVPEGMGLIVRTAGAERTQAEVRRDYEYLLRQWSSIRDLTLKSVAPTLIYEEGSLIKRAIRDLYNNDIDTITVEGEEGFGEAREYMQMLMPNHAKHVHHYSDSVPLFIRHQVESQMNAMLNPTVQLKSGGYIVIGVTEALVAVDVNSGRATKEGSIEETALKTNLEAAEEVARQLKLRDLAGLIVIDFIDMDESKNNRAVEKMLKEKLKNDRARIQIGKISSFGLLEMSRQRLRPGLLEATTSPCPHCHGTGIIRSDESLALSVLRAVEEEGVRGRTAAVRVTAPVTVANYVINHKRARILQIEERYGMQVIVIGDPHKVSPDFTVERTQRLEREEIETAAVTVETGFSEQGVEVPEVVEEPQEDNGSDKRRRRRRKRKDRDGEAVEDAVEVNADDTAADADQDAAAKNTDDASESTENEGSDDADGEEGERSAGRRRGRRGGRRRRKKSDEDAGADPLQVIDLSDPAGQEAAEPASTEAAQTLTPAPSGEIEPETAAQTFPAEAADMQDAAATAPNEPGTQESPVQESPVQESAAQELAIEEPVIEEAALAETATSQSASAADEPELVIADNGAPDEPQSRPAPKRTGWWNLRR
ncbi:MAG: Rne/Rng family ribonuclease [Neomegalonema sp.]|nr:Rne/Rng family ribonuclease [Neomegalonema sp.]